MIFYTSGTKTPAVSVMTTNGEPPHGAYSQLEIGTTSISLRNIDYDLGIPQTQGESLPATAKATNTALHAIRRGKTAKYTAITSGGTTITRQFSLHGAKVMSNAAAIECVGVTPTITTR